MNSLLLQVFCAIFSGVIQGAAVANEIYRFGSPFLGLICLIPLYIAFYKSKNYRQAFLLFALQTLTVHLISSYWLAHFKDFAILTIGGSAFGEALLAGMCGAIFYMFPANHKLNVLQECAGTKPLNSSLRILWFSAAWVIWEWVKSTGFLAYPWATLSVTAYSWKFCTQIASVTGTWGISFLWALVSCTAAEYLLYLENRTAVQDSRKVLSILLTNTKCTALLFAANLIFGLAAYFFPRTPEKYFNVLMVQPNFNSWEKPSDYRDLPVLQQLTEEKKDEMVRNHHTPDLIIWSEGVLNRAFPGSRMLYNYQDGSSNLGSFIHEMHTPLLAGGIATLNQHEGRYGNAAVLFDSQGMYSGFYCKKHLVPFAESVPFKDTELFKMLMKKILGGFSSSWTEGPQFVTFRIPIKSNFPGSTPLEIGMPEWNSIALDEQGHQYAEKAEAYITNRIQNPLSYVTFTAPICFEDAFPDVCRQLYKAGSEVFINITNDSWSLTKSAEYQHFVVASYLAIEFRTTLLRDCNSGYTVAVGPNGKIIKDLPLFERTAMELSVPVYKRVNTIYARCGDWFAYTCILAVVLYALTVLYVIYIKGRKHPRYLLTIRFEKVSDMPEVPAAADNASAQEKELLSDKASVKQSSGKTGRTKARTSVRKSAKTVNSAKTVKSEKNAGPAKKTTSEKTVRQAKKPSSVKTKTAGKSPASETKTRGRSKK